MGLIIHMSNSQGVSNIYTQEIIHLSGIFVFISERLDEQTFCIDTFCIDTQLYTQYVILHLTIHKLQNIRLRYAPIMEYSTYIYTHNGHSTQLYTDYGIIHLAIHSVWIFHLAIHSMEYYTQLCTHYGIFHLAIHPV